MPERVNALLHVADAEIVILPVLDPADGGQDLLLQVVAVLVLVAHNLPEMGRQLLRRSRPARRIVPAAQDLQRKMLEIRKIDDLLIALGLKGYFDINEMKNLRKLGSILQGHPCIQETPGIDMSTGSLGQGVSSAVGMALAAKVDKKDYNVFTVLGDGEMQEGEVWEALMSAAHYKLDNLCAFLDNNGLQIDGKVDDVMSLGDVEAKAAAFGWNVMTINGHDFNEIEKAVEAFKSHKGEGKPFFVVCKTHKGQGVSFMYDNPGFHGKAPNDEEYKIAVAELDAAIAKAEQEVAS